MRLNFTKMHGCGNDYIYFDCFKEQVENPEQLSKIISDRHFGIGGDGIVLICPSQIADAKMRMFNIDGSEGKMCGNAIRCVAKYLYDNNMVKKDEIFIETLSGIKNIKVTAINDKLEKATVDMGRAEFVPSKIPVDMERESIINVPVNIGGKDYNITCVSMGNPHCVVFCDNIDDIEIEKIGPMFENSKLFPERVNTEFIEVLSDNLLKMRVWERGSGETLACGTGACGAVSAAVKNGHCNAGEIITVKLRGGELEIMYTDETVFMTGPATKVFDGQIEL